MSKHYHTSGGIGFIELLTLIFITLKLLDKISWSWWWVLSPIWISASIVIGIIVIIFIIIIIGALLNR